MSPQQYDIYHYLNRTPGQFVSIYEIVKNFGGNRSFADGRYWALESLKNMEKEGLVEEKGHDTQEFRLRDQPDETTVRHQPDDRTVRHQPDDTTEFLRALQSPSAALGDTTIITIRDLEAST